MAASNAPAQKFRSNWFRVAVEGATSDKRKIERTWLEQAAKNFSQNTYGARVWLEHFRSLLPDSPFKAYCDKDNTRAMPMSCIHRYADTKKPAALQGCGLVSNAGSAGARSSLGCCYNGTQFLCGAGCCWVRQWIFPPPSNSSRPGTITTSCCGNRFCRIALA